MTIRATINEIVGTTISTGCLVATVLTIVGLIPAWITHVVSCINNQQWIFLLAGAIMWPIGVIHGFGIWFGVW